MLSEEDEAKLKEILEAGIISQEEYVKLGGTLDSPEPNAEDSSPKVDSESPYSNVSTGSNKKGSSASSKIALTLAIINTVGLFIIGAGVYSNSLDTMVNKTESQVAVVSSNLYKSPNNLKQMLDTASHSIFNVVCTIETGTSSGTGWAISLSNANGNINSYVVTNNHVIEDCFANNNKIYVENEQYGKITASVYSTEGGYWEEGQSLRDLTLLELDTTQNIKGLEIQTAEAEAGQWVSVVGYPGVSQSSIMKSFTVGIISGHDSAGLIVTDAAVNRGNSGGPLLNSEGKVIGSVFAVNDSAEYESMGFAQPIQFHCAIAFECLDGDISYDGDNINLYQSVEVGDCLGYIFAGEYNLDKVSCDGSEEYKVTQEINGSQITDVSQLPECYKGEGGIVEVVEGQLKFYCTTL